MIEENKNIQVALSTMPNLVKWASFLALTDYRLNSS